MHTWLTRLIFESNERPFSLEQAERIAEYVETLPDRLAAVKRLEDNQKWLVKHLTDAVAPKAAEWGLPKEPFTNDFASVLTTMARAVLADDPQLIATDVVPPMADLADALEIPPADLAELFPMAWHILSRRIEPQHTRWFAGYFERAAALLRGDDLPPPKTADDVFATTAGETPSW